MSKIIRRVRLKNNGLLNKELLELICSVGHGDYIMITDRGFPIPSTPYTHIIDLGLAPGFPDFNSIARLIFPRLRLIGSISQKKQEIVIHK